MENERWKDVGIGWKGEVGQSGWGQLHNGSADIDFSTAIADEVVKLRLKIQRNTNSLGLTVAICVKRTHARIVGVEVGPVLA